MSSAAYAGLVPLRPSRVNIPSSRQWIGANGICHSRGYGSASTGAHSRACRARDGRHHHAIDLLRAQAPNPGIRIRWIVPISGNARSRLSLRPAAGNGSRKRTERRDCAARLGRRCRLHLRATGLETSRIGQWKGVVITKGERGGCCGAVLSALVLGPGIRCVSDEHCRGASKRHPLA